MPLFKKKEKAPTATESITRLKEATDVIEKREAFLQSKIDKEMAQARQYMSQKNKRAAMMCLKRKKTYEVQLEKLNASRFTIEQQSMSLSSATINIETLKAMKDANQSMKTIHKDINIDKVDDIIDDVRDQMDLANEITDALGQSFGNTVFDDDELLAELDELDELSLDEQILAPVKMPTAPNSSLEVEKSKQSEDDELAALEASMQ